jgi:hypothetical protein
MIKVLELIQVIQVILQILQPYKVDNPFFVRATTGNTGSFTISGKVKKINFSFKCVWKKTQI